MKNKSILILLGLIFAAVAVFTLNKESEDHSGNGVTKKTTNQSNINSETSLVKLIQATDTDEHVSGHGLVIDAPNDEIIEFNEYLKNSNFRASGNRPSVNLEGLRNLAKSSIDEAKSSILELAGNPKDNFLTLLELNYHCAGLKAVETQLDGVLKNRPFEKSLWDSGYCSSLGNKNDPFFQYLDIARKGNKLVQLMLHTELYLAIERGAVNPRLTPIVFNDLKNETLGYLKDLSAQDVSLASIKLSREYLSDGLLFSTDKVLSYYYLALYEMQHPSFQDHPWESCNSESDYCKSPDELYQTLTEAEKERADRMTKRLK